MVFKYNALWALKRLPSVIICAGRLYSTSLSDAPLTDAKNTRIKEIIQLISNTKTFEIALTHKSYHSIESSAKSYETLEFLGDSILQLYISIFLYKSYPEYSEGKLTEKRTQLVEGKYLASICLRIGLHKYLRVGEDKKDIDFNNKSLKKKDTKIPADIFESFIAALYIEKGGELLNEFLTLTVLDKPEFKKFLKLNNLKFHIKEDSAFSIIVPSGIEDNKTIPEGVKSIINSNDEIKEIFSLYMDESLNNQKEIIQLLIKMYVLMEYNFKTKMSVRGVIKDNSPPEGFL